MKTKRTEQKLLEFKIVIMQKGIKSTNFLILTTGSKLKNSLYLWFCGH